MVQMAGDQVKFHAKVLKTRCKVHNDKGDTTSSPRIVENIRADKRQCSSLWQTGLSVRGVK